MQGDIITLHYLIHVADKKDNIRVAELVTSEVNKICLKQASKKLKLLINFSNISKTGGVPTRSLRSYAEMARNKQFIKAAAAGGNLSVKTLINFVIRLSAREKIYQWFATMPEAVDWLKK